MKIELDVKVSGGVEVRFHGGNDAEILGRLLALRHQLTRMENDMANRDQELSDKLDRFQAVIESQQTVQDSMIKVINDQRATIIDLKEQVESGSVISAGALDNALSRMDNMIASENLQTDEDNNVIAPPPPPLPPVVEAWTASTAYLADVLVAPTTPNGFVYIAGSDGTSGATEPQWPTIVGETVTENGLTWTTRTAGTTFRRR